MRKRDKLLSLGKLTVEKGVDKVERMVEKAKDKYEDHVGKYTEEYYNDACLRRVLSMLVHDVYFRDVGTAGDVAAKLLGYENKSAESYGKVHWEIYPCTEKYPGELKELGLKFFLRKDPHPTSFAPRLAIILRGTIPYIWQDVKEDLRIAMETQRNTNRVQRCQELSLEVIRNFLKDPKCAGSTQDQICIAGHSLGAGLALLVGKHLFSKGFRIDTHLFNPPFVTYASIATLQALPAGKNNQIGIGMLMPKKNPQTNEQAFQTSQQVLQANPQVFQTHPQVFQTHPQVFQTPPQVFQTHPQVFQTNSQHSSADLSTVWTSLMGNGANPSPKLQVAVGQMGTEPGILASMWVKTFGREALEQEWEEFQKLKDWTPHFYLNPSDLVCLQYLKYYKKRQEKANIANVVDPQGIITRVFGKNAKYISNVVPSADLYISTMFHGNPLLAHSLKQWHKYLELDTIPGRLERMAARLLGGRHHLRQSARHLAHEAHMFGRSMLGSPRSPRAPKSPSPSPSLSCSSEPAAADALGVSDEFRMLQHKYENFVPNPAI